MRTIVHDLCWVRHGVHRTVPSAVGFSSCAGQGSCTAVSEREVSTDVTKHIGGSGLARVRVSPGSHSHGPNISRQKLTYIYPTRLRAKVDLWIRRVHLIEGIIYGTISFNVLKTSIHQFRKLSQRTIRKMTFRVPYYRAAVIVNIPGCLPDISQMEGKDGGYLVTTCQTFPPRAGVNHWQG